ncbi:tRNA glutamyl-Q(34) synthetase GluQRS [Aminobacter sp. MDW-2]|jgi:glutamyl-Q tRNA(Asp) synthetase|uniref:tRNA glutamyl-Q(34) synthetase GluQRS n=1 Tax=Aminobacter sp. MDW-2 TaxID=2666139 RepID=UPI0012B0E774|nr:tRNA glutamyl-Q(34) synthetase GluQRS [Aminobacter sp. MDW-2]MRX35182.1 tRNA glutamyl-Q(34) synthetase GluQRS [Aminobacter sp. MDW-2]QNH36121.1 tRNA glutamyl-Q(34) synthetase GluQRS [Aminobacter sp. MDW-2]
MTAPVFRFAPSPNGELHLGHALSALTNERMAASAGGRLLLRIEDIDITRCNPEFEAGIFRDLAWLGVAYERPVRRQSDHFAEYEAALERLKKDELVYPAFMSRGEIRGAIMDHEASGESWPRDPDGAPVYPGADKQMSQRERRRRINAGAPFAWRLDTAAALARLDGHLSWREWADEAMDGVAEIAADPLQWGDVIIARREIPTSYHLSVVLDDALQGVSHVVRGKDLYFATSVQRLLQQVLGLPQPGYFHHRLITGPDGRKLSKSQRDTGLAALREAGETPESVKAMLERRASDWPHKGRSSP